MIKERFNKVITHLEAIGLNQLVITDPASIFYLTGWHIDPMERFLALYINKGGEKTLIVNELFKAPTIPVLDIVYFKDTQDGAAVLSRLTEKDKPLGIDKNMAARFLLRMMEDGAASNYINSSICVDMVRAIKDKKEIELMFAASLLNDRVIEEAALSLYEGMTEEELAAVVVSLYKKHGADGTSFGPLIGFGANAADGHHAPDSTKLSEGDCVLIDIGCVKDSYCSDMTRTFFFHRISNRMKDVYNLVKAANETAKLEIKPGVPLKKIDATARKIIEKAGYGANFNHRLGHFIGTEVHEFGDVSSVSKIIAEPGMVFSIEPGIYLPDEGGVRIEDLVVVTETGCESLNKLSRELKIL